VCTKDSSHQTGCARFNVLKLSILGQAVTSNARRCQCQQHVRGDRCSRLALAGTLTGSLAAWEIGAQRRERASEGEGRRSWSCPPRRERASAQPSPASGRRAAQRSAARPIPLRFSTSSLHFFALWVLPLRCLLYRCSACVAPTEAVTLGLARLIDCWHFTSSVSAGQAPRHMLSFPPPPPPILSRLPLPLHLPRTW